MASDIAQAINALGTLSPFERCLVILPSGKDLAHIITTCWDAETTLALLKPSVREQDRANIIRNYDPTIVVADDGGQGIRVSWRTSAARHPMPVEDGSLTVFTSGTTGPPKGVVLPRSAVRGNALKTAALHGLGLNRPQGTCLELFHVNALVMSLIGTHETGERLVFNYSRNPADYFATLQAQEARTASVNPVELARIVKEHPPWPEQLDYLVTAAGPCSLNLVRTFHSLYGPRLRQGYGLSEAINFSFVMPLLDDTDFRRYYLEARPPVGLALPGTEFVIDNDELYIRTPDMMLGYLLEESPSNIDDEGWLRTGDHAALRDGFVVLRGRVADSIRHVGGRILPTDIEDQLALPPECGEYAVARISHEEGDGLSLFTSEAWHPALSMLIQTDTETHFGFVRAGGLRLSASGKVQRGVMAQDASRVLDGLAALGMLDPPEPTTQWLNGLHGAVFGRVEISEPQPEVRNGFDCTCREIRVGATTTVITAHGTCPCFGKRFLVAETARLVVVCSDPDDASAETAADFYAEWELLRTRQQSLARIASLRGLVLSANGTTDS